MRERSRTARRIALAAGLIALALAWVLAARGLWRRRRRPACASLADPDPPSWVYILDEDHPTIVQRIAMADAWQRRDAGAQR